MSAKVIARKTLDNPDLQKMFNQMVGATDPDPVVVAPKYEKILEDCKVILSAIKRIWIDRSRIPPAIIKDFPLAFSSIDDFHELGMQQLEKYTLVKKQMLSGKDLEKLNSNPELMMEYLQSLSHGYNNAELGEAYKSLKSSTLIDAIILSTRDLQKLLTEDAKEFKRVAHCLASREKLSDAFISESDEMYMQLIPSMTLMDFKQVWMHSDCNYEVRQRFVYALFIILHRGHAIVEHIMSPDIDVDKFSELLVSSIKQLKAHIPRCDKAFNKIQQSVELLKTNFSGYYADFITSKNPSVIVENFVFDVANTSSGDAELTRQFREIVKFYKKQMANQAHDPQIKQLFDLVDENINVLARKTGVKDDEEPEDEAATEV